MTKCAILVEYCLNTFILIHKINALQPLDWLYSRESISAHRAALRASLSEGSFINAPLLPFLTRLQLHNLSQEFITCAADVLLNRWFDRQTCVSASPEPAAAETETFVFFLLALTSPTSNLTHLRGACAGKKTHERAHT